MSCISRPPAARRTTCRPGAVEVAAEVTWARNGACFHAGSYGFERQTGDRRELVRVYRHAITHRAVPVDRRRLLHFAGHHLSNNPGRAGRRACHRRGRWLAGLASVSVATGLAAEPAGEPPTPRVDAPPPSRSPSGTPTATVTTPTTDAATAPRRIDVRSRAERKSRSASGSGGGSGAPSRNSRSKSEVMPDSLPVADHATANDGVAPRRPLLSGS